MSPVGAGLVTILLCSPPSPHPITLLPPDVGTLTLRMTGVTRGESLFAAQVRLEVGGTNVAARVRVLALAVLLTTVPMLGALAHTPHDDAGSGEDAPDDRSEAMNVTPGSFVGNLTPGADDHHDQYESYEDNNITKDHDWYRVNTTEDADEPSCTRADYAPDNKPHNDTKVRLEQPALPDAEINTTATTGETLSLVGPSSSGALVGLSQLDPPRVTAYDVEIEVTTLSDIEETGGSGGTADTIPGPCFGGTLEDMEIHDWTFEAEEGQVLWVSFGTELDRLDDLVLEAPNGTEIGSITSGDDIAIGGAELPQTGNYTLSAEGGDSGLFTTTSSTYITSFTLYDPEEEEEEGQHCDPHCMKIS